MLLIIFSVIWTVIAATVFFLGGNTEAFWVPLVISNIYIAAFMATINEKP